MFVISAIAEEIENAAIELPIKDKDSSENIDGGIKKRQTCEFKKFACLEITY